MPYRRWLTGLTAWAGGFSALESDDEDALSALWTSLDGAVWRRAPLPKGVVNGQLVALGDHLYLLEFRGRGDSHEVRIRTWRTGDGSEWQRQGLFEWHLPRSVSDDWRILVRHVAPAPDRLVMFGVIDPCCGSGGSIPGPARFASHVAVAAVPQRVPLGGLVVWTSPDGAEWTRQPIGDLRDPASGDNAKIADVAGVPDGVLATRPTDDTLFHSPDGSTWESMGPLPPGYSSLSHGLMTTEDHVVFAFDAEDPRGNDLEVWLRTTGGDWVRSLDEPYTSGDALVATGSLVMLAATGYDAGAESWPRLFVSTDGGATWDPGLSWSGPRGGCARDLATDGTRLVLFGCDEGAPTLWYADVPGSPVKAPSGDSR